MDEVRIDDLDSPEPQEAGRDVLEYLEVPFRYPRYFWIPCLLIFTLAVLAAMVLPKKYRSATLILVEHNDLPDYFVTALATEGVARRLQTIREVVMSRTNLENVLQELDPYPDAAGVPTQVVVESMRRAIDIRVRGKDSFSIEYVNRDPFKAMMVTQMLATGFTEDAAYIRDNLTTRAYAFVQSSLDEARSALEERESALRRHKQRYWGSLPEQLESNLRVLQQLQLEQQTLGGNLQTLEGRRTVLERTLLEGGREGGASLGPAAQLALLKKEFASLRDRYTEQHPDMVILQLRIRRLESQLANGTAPASAESQALTSRYNSLELVEKELEALDQKRDELDERIAAYQARIEQTPKAEQQLAALNRDYYQLRENYNAALKKQLESENARKLEQYWKSGYFRVLDPAYLPRRPIRPYAALLLFVGLTGGLFVGLGSVVLADLLDRSVKTERELEQLVPYPLLVTLPRAGTAAGASGPGA